MYYFNVAYIQGIVFNLCSVIEIGKGMLCRIEFEVIGGRFQLTVPLLKGALPAGIVTFSQN